MRPLTHATVIAAALLPLLAGCGSGHAPAPAAAVTQVNKKTPADALGREFVAALALVKPGTPAIPVQVKFSLLAHPEPGQPVGMDLALVPTAGTLDRLAGKVRGEEGLTVVSGADIPDAQKPAEGVPVRHSVQLQAAQDGIYELTVEVTADAGGISSTQSFSIPVLAGKGMADLPTSGTVSAPVAATKPPASGTGH